MKEGRALAEKSCPVLAMIEVTGVLIGDYGRCPNDIFSTKGFASHSFSLYRVTTKPSANGKREGICERTALRLVNKVNRCREVETSGCQEPLPVELVRRKNENGLIFVCKFFDDIGVREYNSTLQFFLADCKQVEGLGCVIGEVSKKFSLDVP